MYYLSVYELFFIYTTHSSAVRRLHFKFIFCFLANILGCLPKKAHIRKENRCYIASLIIEMTKTRSEKYLV